MRIITHNAHWFHGYIAGNGLFNTEKLTSIILDQLASVYKELSPDILCLQEVESEDQARKLAEIMGMQYCFIPHGKRKGYNGAILYGLDIELKVSNIGKQNCDRFIAFIQLPHLSIGVVHLLYPYANESEEVWDKHCRELNLLFKNLPDVDVILGDFNMLEDAVNYHWLLDKGFMNLLKSDPHHRVDHIFIREKMRNIITLTQTLLSDKKFVSFEGRNVALSDHPGSLMELEGII